MDRERLALIIYKTGYLTVNEAEELIDKILTEEQNKKVYCPYCGFQIFATCYCSKPEPGGNMSCMKCLKPLPYIFIPKAKEPPKNKIEPLDYDKLALRIYELAVNDLKKRFEEIGYNKQ